jgi:sigma-B regulation protein RsbU (phosphoserine phosphatase)
MNNNRIALAIDTVRAISRTRTPQDVNHHISDRFRRLANYDGFITLSCRNLPSGAYKITRFTIDPQADAQRIEASNPWRDWDKLPMYRGGFLGDLIATGYPEVIHRLDIIEDPVLGGQLREFGSCLAVPLYDEGEPLNWAIFLRRDPEGMSIEMLEQSIMTSNLVGRATRNLVMAEEVRRLNEQLQMQLQRVAEIQQSLLPERLPKIKGAKVAASYLTADDAGGDYYDFLPLPNDRWGVSIADVSGHGVGAGTIMAMMHTLLHAAAPDLLAEPDALLGYLNNQLAAKRLEGQFVTAFYGVYDPATGDLRYARAGHPPPRRKLVDGGVVALNGDGTAPLGIVPDLAAPVSETHLDPGETLVLYTDGIIEAFNRQNVMFGLEGLDGAISSCSGAPQCLIDSAHEALHKHTGTMTRDDDQTIVAMQRLLEACPG